MPKFAPLHPFGRARKDRLVHPDSEELVIRGAGFRLVNIPPRARLVNATIATAHSRVVQMLSSDCVCTTRNEVIRGEIVKVAGYLWIDQLDCRTASGQSLADGIPVGPTHFASCERTPISSRVTDE
jgi:hypothetical protein